MYNDIYSPLQYQKSFIALKIQLVPPIYPFLPSPQTLATTDLFLKLKKIFVSLCWFLVAACKIFIATCRISCLVGMRALSCGAQAQQL